MAHGQKEKMKSVNIIGMSDSWQLAPMTGESWGINGIIFMRDVDILFDMHDLTWNEQRWFEHYRTWLSPYKPEDHMIKKAIMRYMVVKDEVKKINETGTILYSVKNCCQNKGQSS